MSRDGLGLPTHRLGCVVSQDRYSVSNVGETKVDGISHSEGLRVQLE